MEKEKKLTPGSELASMRKIVDFVCAFCGKKKQGTKRRKYCNETCKQAKRAEIQKEQRRLKKGNKQQ